MTGEGGNEAEGTVLKDLIDFRKRRTELEAEANRCLAVLGKARDELGRVIKGPPASPYIGAPPSSKEWPSHADLERVSRDLREVRARVEELNGKLRKWGAID